MRLTHAERLMAEVGVIALCACGFAVLGIFTPPDMPLSIRLAYWIVGFIASWALVRILANVGGALAKLFGIAQHWGYALTIPLATVGITWGLLYWTGGSELALSHTFAQIWPSALLIGLGFFALFFALYSRVDFSSDDADPSAKPRTPAPAQTDLHGRLPAGFPAILALSVEDHYTRVHASERSEMVLMPLGEAIAMVLPAQGRQVHRSWWVAKSAVVRHKREGRDIKLTLTNGLEVPVSRANTKALRDAGWLG